jgi:hypothetical protein
MSISLSGGDIAFIAAFIVLPICVLASCIWAIIAIRSGALLPQRSALPAHEDDAEAMSPEWPYVVGEQTAFDNVDPAAAQLTESVTGTAEHIAILPDASPVSEAGAEPDGFHPAAEPNDAVPSAPITTEELAVDTPVVQETGEFPLVGEHDWSRPTIDSAPLDAHSAATSAEPPAADGAAEPIDIETWDTEPEPEPEPEPVASAPADDEQDVDEPLPDASFEHTTDLPPPVAIKRKPARKAVAQLRPPVASTGRSRLRPAAARRAGEAIDDNGLAGEDEGTVQGDNGAVDIRPADDE